MITLKDSISDYTEAEFLRLVEEICSATGGEEYQDNLLENFIQVTEHPAGSDLIYYPESGADDTPEGVLQAVKEWRLASGLPGFKSS